MPTHDQPTPKPKPAQEKPLWEYLAGGLLWGAGFFGAALALKRLFPNQPTDEDLDNPENW